MSMPEAGWVRLTDEQLSGEALAPYGDGVLSAGYMVAKTPHEPGQKMLAVFEGEIWVALYEFTGGENVATFFPGDEFVYVVAGTLTLTDTRTGESRTFDQGEHVLIPKGWQGSWANEGLYREVAVCSRDWLRQYTREFQSGIVDPERRSEFLAIETRTATPPRGDSANGAGPHSTHVHGSDLLVRLIAAEAGTSLDDFRGDRDAFVQVIDGRVVLTGDDGAREEFVAGDCLIVSGDARERWDSRDGLQALVVQAGAPADFRGAAGGP
jgi:uncharacterized cupin superfamily protein